MSRRTYTPPGATTATSTGQAFGGFGADPFRTAITRACRAAGVRAFSPHDLRHRRATL